MYSINSSWTNLLSMSGLIVLLSACGGYQPESDYDNLDAPLLITEQVATLKDDGTFFFGNITDGRITPDGHFVLLDFVSKKIHLYSDDGGWQGSFLQEGQGPGEVRNVSGQLSLNSDGVIGVYDFSQRRLSVFQYASSRLDHVKDIGLSQFPAGFHISSSDKLYLQTSPIGGRDQIGKERIAMMDMDGNMLSDSLLIFPRSNSLTIRNEGGAMMMQIGSQYHDKNIYRMHDDRLVVTRSGVVGFTVYDLVNGDSLSGIRLHVPEIPLDYDTKDTFVGSLMGNGFIDESLRPSLIADMPDIKAPVTHMHFDPAGQIWLGLADEISDKWLVFTDTGRLVAAFPQLEEGRLISIHHNHMFIQHEDELGESYVTVYRYRIP